MSGNVVEEDWKTHLSKRFQRCHRVLHEGGFE